jgi:type 1 glutamine amidotransferase
MKVQFKDVQLKRLPLADGEKKVVLVAGRKSHGFGAHEHRAGCMLLAKRLNANVPKVVATVYDGGWPQDPTAFDNANSIVLYMDGGGGHPVNRHLPEVDALMDEGVGLVCIHYAVEVPKGEPGDHMLKWTGGYFETWWSVNPHWTAEFKSLPDHPVARGVEPFSINDEWYYHMRFRPDMDRVSPVLSAIPPASTLERKDGPHSNNPQVRARKGMSEHVAWASERDGGGRGFGFTGGHFHWGWGHDDFRTLVLNAIVWTTGSDVPQGGVQSPTPTIDELLANQDYDAPKNFDRASLEKKLQTWNGAR